mgnify:CR=1 FL=1
MNDDQNLESKLLHPPQQWYYELLTGQVTQNPGQNRMGPYPTEDEARNALEIAAKRNEEWQMEDDEWNGKK